MAPSVFYPLIIFLLDTSLPRGIAENSNVAAPLDATLWSIGLQFFFTRTSSSHLIKRRAKLALVLRSM